MGRLYTLRETEVQGLPLLEVHYPQDLNNLELCDGPFKRVVVHHAGSKDYSIDELIYLHVHKKEMAAIGYHFLIGPQGELYYTRDTRFKGAHAYPNTGKLGIGFLRSFEQQSPNRSEIATFNRFVQVLGLAQLPIVGHNQDQVLELVKQYGFITDYPAILRVVWQPGSASHFEQAKEQLRNLFKEQKYQDEVAKLKTCPGVHGLAELMQHG